MIRKIFYGEVNQLTTRVIDLGITEKMALGFIVVLIFFFGIYPQGLLDLTKETSEFILRKANFLKGN
jgi:NADH-quinone oxidoreductase subunit M